jgi:AcrR family transcriptional regulator
MKLARHGSVVSVAEVAAAAGLSRATAYRYFPTHSALITAIVDESLGPVRGFESTQRDGPTRIQDLFEQTFVRLSEFEPQLRAALQVALDHWAREKSGILTEEPFRRGNRRDILSRAANPLAKSLGKKAYERMLKALSLVYGIEAYVVLKDIWGANNKEVHRVAMWVAQAIMEKAAHDSTSL